MKSVDIKILDETCEQLRLDDGVMVALDDYARGFISKSEMADRIEFLKIWAEQRAVGIIAGPSEPDDCEARVGTWASEEIA